MESGAVPSFEQGFGIPVLDDALYFAGESQKLLVSDIPLDRGIAAGVERTIRINAKRGTPLKVVLAWTDPPGEPRSATDSTPVLLNDLDLRVRTPDGRLLLGNDSPGNGEPDRRNNVEIVSIDEPVGGSYAIMIAGERIAHGPRQSLAVVVTGDVAQQVRTRPARR